MSGTTSGKLRIRAVAQRMARGESGVTLVEMMVSLFIFAIVSTMFTTAIVQYLHSTSADAIRSRSSTEIATSVQSLDRYVRYAEGVEYDATNHTLTMVTPGDSGAKQCVVITYQDATWKNGTVSDYGSVKVKTKPYDASVTSWSTRAVLGSVMNNESGGTSDDSLFASRLFTMDGTNRVVRSCGRRLVPYGASRFLLPPSAPCDTPEKGGYSSFFKKRDCKDLLSGCAEKQAICGVVFFVARFWFCVVPFVAA